VPSRAHELSPRNCSTPAHCTAGEPALRVVGGAGANACMQAGAGARPRHARGWVAPMHASTCCTVARAGSDYTVCTRVCARRLPVLSSAWRGAAASASWHTYTSVIHLRLRRCAALPLSRMCQRTATLPDVPEHRQAQPSGAPGATRGHAATHQRGGHVRLLCECTLRLCIPIGRPCWLLLHGATRNPNVRGRENGAAPPRNSPVTRGISICEKAS